MRATLVLILSLCCLSANAALHSRASGQAYYDDVLNITWLADADYARTSGYVSDGIMTWAAAQTWIGSLNAASHLGVNDWALPVTVQPDATCAGQYDPGSPHPLQGYSIGCTGSPMGHLFYVDGIASATPSPFSNVRPNLYWSDTTVPFDTANAWSFDFGTGSQNTPNKGQLAYAWAVRTGDIGAVPDGDSDGVPDGSDNCTLVPNNEAGTVPNSPGALKSQLDADGDGYGNACDGDLNNTGLVTAQDNTILRNLLNQTYDFSANAAAADMNGSGLVTAQDNTILRNRLNLAPGPSGYGCGQPAGSVVCP